VIKRSADASAGFPGGCPFKFPINIMPKKGFRLMRKRLLLSSAAAGIIMPLAAPAILNFPLVGANTLTALLPTIFQAMDVVSRELAGFIPTSMRAPGVERAAVGQSVTYPIAPAMAAYDVAPAMAIPEPPDVTPEVGTMAITKSRAVPFGFTGEEARMLNTGVGYLSTQGQWIAQALRTLVNEIEADLAAEAAANASRAYGTAGTTPFATNLGDLAQVRKMLDDNGAPPSDRALVGNTAMGANLRTLSQLTKVNEAGTQMTLRQGELLDVFNFSIHESAQVVNFVAGTNNGSAATDNAGYAVGATLITLGSAGTGTIKAGDVITFAGDTNKYVVASGDTDVSNGGTITLSKPGLRVAIPAAATVITTIASHASNVAFSQSALHIAMRPPAAPPEGDQASDRLLVTDPRTGVTFEFSVWPGYRKVRLEVALAWGVKATKREHIVLLLG
jgi:hypothetical protein